MVRRALHRYKKVALLCAILATALVPTTGRAAYAEVGTPAVAQLADANRTEAEPQPAQLALAKISHPRKARRFSIPSTTRIRSSDRLYLLHRALLR
jgi:hypothetical protein